MDTARETIRTSHKRGRGSHPFCREWFFPVVCSHRLIETAKLFCRIYVVAPELLYFLEGLIKRFLQLARGLAQFILIYIPQLVLDRHYVRIPFLLKRSLTLPRVHFH